MGLSFRKSPVIWCKGNNFVSQFSWKKIRKSSPFSYKPEKNHNHVKKINSRCEKSKNLFNFLAAVLYALLLFRGEKHKSVFVYWWWIICRVIPTLRKCQKANLVMIFLEVSTIVFHNIEALLFQLEVNWKPSTFRWAIHRKNTSFVPSVTIFIVRKR